MTNETRSLPYSTRIIYAMFDKASAFGWNRLFWSVIALSIVAVLASGFYIIKKEEQGVLVRFGKVVDENLGPGIHYRVPFIYEAHIRKVKRIVRVPIVSEGTGGDTHVTLLSGDTNLVEVDVAVQYKIDNLRNYLHAVSDPVMLMTMLVREEMVNIVGQNFIDLILTSNRSIIERHLHDYLAGRLETIDIGIELVDLNIVDIRPIEETVEAFRDVNDAISERMQSISNANLRREKLVARTKGQTEAIVMDAEATARERVLQAESSAGAFSRLLDEYTKQPAQVGITRYWQRMRTIFAEANLAAVNPGNDANIEVNLVDGGTRLTPVEMAFDSPEALSAVGPDSLDRPVYSTLPPNIHRYENIDRDGFLIEGRFHSRNTERDHLPVARPRSLIFDTPSIFSHGHVATSSTDTANQSGEKAMVDTMHDEESDEEPNEGTEGSQSDPNQ